MKKVFMVSFVALVVFACNKKEPVAAEKIGEAAKMVADPGCSKEIITDKPVKAGETGIVLPVGTKLCFTTDNLEIRVTLPAGYTFITKGDAGKPLPAYATYTCNCSVVNSHCQVFYAEGMGFGCLQSSCSGACTGKFTYAGYTVDKVVSTIDKTEFFNLPEVKAEISKIKFDGPYSKQSVFGVSFYLVNDEKLFLPKATCDCQGTLACKLKTITLPFLPKIYVCEGGCNGCELTVS